MKTHPYTQLFAAICVGALASCASGPTPTKMPVSASLRPNSSNSGQSSHSSSSVSGQLLQKVNSYRSSQGKGKLQRHSGLDRLAQQHCEYLRKNRGTFSLNGKNVSHFGFQGRSAVARERYSMLNFSENVAAGYHPNIKGTTVIMNLWKGSKNHHKNMLNDWNHTGIGVVVDSDGMIFATQLFSTVNHSQMATRERFNGF